MSKMFAECLGQRKTTKSQQDDSHCQCCYCTSQRSSGVDLEKHVPDEIRPYNFLDDDPEFRHSVAFMTFRINAVLDAQKLRDALDEVFQLEGWHRLGARIRLDVGSDSSYQVVYSG